MRNVASLIVERPILVTGSHRSGTGWVGDMLAATPSPHLGLIWEPFNLKVSRGVRDAPFHHWFTYVCDENAGEFEPAMRVALLPLPRVGRGTVDAIGEGSGAPCARLGSLRAGTATGAVALSKDPIVFSAAWLADTFDMDVVISIRHPAAMVASVMRLGWSHPSDHLLAQPAMMREVLARHAETIEWFASAPHPVLDQASFLWALICERVLGYREQRPEWHFVRHEDLSLDPIARFEKLYASLGLTWTNEVEAVVNEHTRAGNAVEVHDPSNHHRDSRAAVQAWKHRLSTDEIERIRRWTGPVASAFYGDDEW